MPKSLVPALLLIRVRSLAPWSRRAAMRFSGIPHRPKPETMMEAPSETSRTASAASFTNLFMEKSLRGPQGRRPVDDSRRKRRSPWRERSTPPSGGCRPSIRRAIPRTPDLPARPATPSCRPPRRCPTARPRKARCRPPPTTPPASPPMAGRTPTTRAGGTRTASSLPTAAQRAQEAGQRAVGLATVLGEDLPPQAGRAGGEPRHAGEARARDGQAPDRERIGAGRVEKRPRDELRHVAQERDHPVVLGRVHAHRPRARGAGQPADGGQ